MQVYFQVHKICKKIPCVDNILLQERCSSSTSHSNNRGITTYEADDCLQTLTLTLHYCQQSSLINSCQEAHRGSCSHLLVHVIAVNEQQSVSLGLSSFLSSLLPLPSLPGHTKGCNSLSLMHFCSSL